ncbi:MAG: hypothetical protein INR68_01460 [Methylobacterium mesophilicum]|nr:hypothetical protein [Methylobacterium mesophilicum]
MNGNAGRDSIDSDARRLRADAYVLGRLRAVEREQAEADLETDQAFRDAVLAAAHRLGQLPDIRGDGASPAGWEAIAAHLTTLPHMQPRSGLEDQRGPRAETRQVDERKAPPALLKRLGRAVGETVKTLRALLRASR